MKMGIEIECLVDLSEGSKGQNIFEYIWNGRWDLKTDGSIRLEEDFFAMTGLEYVSPIIRSEYFLKRNVENICNRIAKKRGFVNNSCGLHIHLNANKDRFLRELRAVRYSIIEDDLLKNIKTLRKYNYYSKSHRSYGLAYMDDRDRYKTVNLAAYNRHGTIEFRQHRGTIDADEIINWALFLKDFDAQCQKYEEKSIYKGFTQEISERYKNLGSYADMTRVINNSNLSNLEELLPTTKFRDYMDVGHYFNDFYTFKTNSVMDTDPWYAGIRPSVLDYYEKKNSKGT